MAYCANILFGAVLTVLTISALSLSHFVIKLYQKFFDFASTNIGKKINKNLFKKRLDKKARSMV